MRMRIFGVLMLLRLARGLRYVHMSTGSQVVTNYNTVQSRITAAAVNCGRDVRNIQLVAVSKTKPIEDIQELYDAGHRHFGENYLQELVDKAEVLPKDIIWHFIGTLQSNKASKIITGVPNLGVIETVDSLKLARKIHHACEVCKKESVNILIQVCTSDEDTKSGVNPSELSDLVSCILAECPRLVIKGVMTIGAPNDYTCFDSLVDCRCILANILHVSPESLVLSMGMSGDFEQAIEKGATSVRVGSSIFGERDYSTK